MLSFYLRFKSEKSFCWNMYDAKLEITQIIKCNFQQKLILFLYEIYSSGYSYGHLFFTCYITIFEIK